MLNSLLIILSSPKEKSPQFWWADGRHLIPDNPEEIKFGREIQKVNQAVRILPKIKQFNMDFTIYENKLSLTSLEEEPFMVLIESQDLVDSMKPIFEIAWQNGQRIKTK